MQSNPSSHFFLHLDETKRSCLDWGKRFEIICGIARGILYLYQDSRSPWLLGLEDMHIGFFFPYLFLFWVQKVIVFRGYDNVLVIKKGFIYKVFILHTWCITLPWPQVNVDPMWRIHKWNPPPHLKKINNKSSGLISFIFLYSGFFSWVSVKWVPVSYRVILIYFYLIYEDSLWPKGKKISIVSYQDHHNS